MSVHYVYIENGAKKMRPVHTRQEYMALRESEENRRAQKRRMVQMNYSCLPNEDGSLRGSRRMSTTVGMDIDVPVDSASVIARKEELGLLMFEHSASKPGCAHIVFRRRRGLTQEENLKWASAVLGVPYDQGAKDITRVFYTPAGRLVFLDDEIFTIEEAADAAMPPRQDLAPSAPPAPSGKSAPSETYLGIPYAEIVQKYWAMFYGGQEPVKSNRDTLTYELANVMKHICGFDREMLARVIPCYDGFPEAEKMKCIDSALAGKRTQMPRRLREVLHEIQRSRLISGGHDAPLGELDGALVQDELFYYNRIPRTVMVQGLKESVEAAGRALCMPVIAAVCPAIGARATGVRLVVHGKANTLNLISYIAGDFASGKGQIDDVVKAWMSEDIAMAEMYNRQWAEYAEKKKQSKNKKEQPVEPRFPKVWLTLNNTTANLAEELANVQGRHAFSFTPEADVVSTKWKSSISDFSTMIRQSYDGSSYDREARSVDAVNVHIPRLLWNVVMCGTPDALYRVVDNYTDGFQSRIAVARTPDNTFAPLEDNPAHLTERQRERIVQVSHLLPLMNGSIELPRLEARGREWLEEVRLETIKNDDKVMARQRMRICVTAQRMTCCLMLTAVCARLMKEHGAAGAEARLKNDPLLWQRMTEKMQTQAFMDMFGLIADSLIDNALYFFRDRIEDAFSARTYGSHRARLGGRMRKGSNDSIYARLPDEFGMGEAMAQSVSVKGNGVTHNAVRQMLKNWTKQGLVGEKADGRYEKIKK
ncbi:MAG: DUF3987 domain-containing protein [Bacteroidaceae bacterium]